MSPTDRFSRCLAEILRYEGGFSDNPKDSGGPTFRGVTLASLNAWRGIDCTVADLKALTDQDVADFYRGNYWNAVHGDSLPAGVDLMAFDCAVNQGPGIAIRLLQSAAGVPADGAFGPITQAAVMAADPTALVSMLSGLRASRYRATAQFQTFGDGWLTRLARCLGTARAWAAAQEIA